MNLYESIKNNLIETDEFLVNKTPYGFTEVTYKGYTISNMFGNITVNVGGDDVYCNSLDEAISTIDGLESFDYSIDDDFNFLKGEYDKQGIDSSTSLFRTTDINEVKKLFNEAEGSVVKLTKDTRDSVEVGDILEDNSNKYVVTNVINNPRSKAITVRDASDWRPIYATPISEWYGTRIVKGPFIREDGKITKKSLSESHSEDYCTVAAAEFVVDSLPADWKSLSEDELKDLVYDGVTRYNDGNTEPEYTDSDFYGDSADPDKVYNYIVNNF